MNLPLNWIHSLKWTFLVYNYCPDILLDCNSQQVHTHINTHTTVIHSSGELKFSAVSLDSVTRYNWYYIWYYNWYYILSKRLSHLTYSSAYLGKLLLGCKVEEKINDIISIFHFVKANDRLFRKYHKAIMKIRI